MNNGLILLITFLLPLIAVVVFYLWLSKRKKRHVETLKSDWFKFENAIKNKHVGNISKYGRQLIYNENLTDDQLKIMKKSIDKLVVKNSELEELINLIYNKFLHWNRDYSNRL